MSFAATALGAVNVINGACASERHSHRAAMKWHVCITHARVDYMKSAPEKVAVRFRSRRDKSSRCWLTHKIHLLYS